MSIDRMTSVNQNFLAWKLEPREGIGGEGRGEEHPENGGQGDGEGVEEIPPEGERPQRCGVVLELPDLGRSSAGSG